MPTPRSTLLLLTLSLTLSHAMADGFQVDPEMQAARQKALDRPRRVLWNHDGGGSVAITPDSLQDFLHHRLTRVADTEVDTIMFCTLSSGFSRFSHFTKVGQIIGESYQGTHRNVMNLAKLSDYVDPLTAVVDFGHAHKMEVFWSMRMNDVHDGNNTDYGPRMFASNALKVGHPEYLLGSPDHRPFHGSWTAVNYELPEIRDLAFRYIQEVCQNYDVDGIELDFFRHPNFFHYPDADQPVTQAQRDLMTGLMQRIRTMADAEGKKRGRPILIAMKVPDSVAYCQAVGIDLESWLAKGLMDMLIPGGYIRMNPWETMVDLGHKYGVKVYPCMDEPRLKVVKKSETMDSSQALRDAAGGYRGRAAEAWAAQADGIYLFNFFDGSIIMPPNVVLKEIGTPEGSVASDRTYFASYLGLAKVSSGGYPHRAFQKIETLSLTEPKSVPSGQPVAANLVVPEAFPANGGETLTLKLRLNPMPHADHLVVALNGRKLEGGSVADDWISYSCPPDLFVKGDNKCEIQIASDPSAKTLWQDLALVVTVKK